MSAGVEGGLKVDWTLERSERAGRSAASVCWDCCWPSASRWGLRRPPIAPRIPLRSRSLPRAALRRQPHVAGAVTLVATKDKVLSLEAVGYTDVAAKKPMRPTTCSGSLRCSKPITATALMMLVDEGKVNVDDPVEKYLPEFKGQMAGGGKGQRTTCCSRSRLIRSR